MKRITLSILLAGTMLAQVANAQSSSTPVIGYYKFDVPEGTTLWTCGFVTKKEFQGAATSAAPSGINTEITQTGATFGAFASHYVEILSGSQAGLILDIVSNTGDKIVVEGSVTIAPGTTYCVRAHNTLGTVLAGGGGLVAGNDTVTIYNEIGSDTFTHNGSNWEDAGANDADPVKIYPGQGFIIDRPVLGGAVATVTMGGNTVSYVKSGPTMVSLYPGVPNIVGLVNPLVALNPGDPAFAASSSTVGQYDFVSTLVAGNDSVDVYSQDGLFTSPGSYISNGSNMEDGGASDVNGVSIRNGAAVVIGVSLDGVYKAPQLHP